MIDPNTGIEYPDDPSMLQKFNMFMNTPGAAMMGAAMSNLGQIGMGAAPTHNPFMAMQQARAQNQQLMQMRALQLDRQQEREQMRRLRDLQIQKTEQGLDPFFEYRQFQQQFPEQAEGVTYQDFQRMGLRSSDMSALGKNVALMEQRLGRQLTQEEIMDLHRNQTMQGPGSTILRTLPGGGAEWVIDPKIAAAIAATEAAGIEGGKTTAGGTAQTAVDQTRTAIDTTWASRDAYNIAQQMRDTSRQYLDSIKQGDLSTGPIDSFLMNWFGVGSKELAAMDADAVDNLLQNLQITNLAPVTVQELREVAKLWARASAQERPNEAVLERAIRKAESVMEKMQLEAKINANRVKTYGSEDEYNMLLQSNPFVQQALGQQAPTGPAQSQQSQTYMSPTHGEVTEEDIEYTMRLHGVSREEVLRRLGID